MRVYGAVISALTYIHVQSKTTGGGLPVLEDQEKLLTEALNVVKRNSFEMKTCLVRVASQTCTY